MRQFTRERERGIQVKKVQSSVCPRGAHESPPLRLLSLSPLANLPTKSRLPLRGSIHHLCPAWTDEHVNRKCLCNHISHLRDAEGGQKLSPPERQKDHGVLCSHTMPAKRCGSWWPGGCKWPTGNKHYNYWLNRNGCLGVCRSLLGVRSRCLSTEGNSDNRQAKSDISLYRITPGLRDRHCSFSVTMSPSRKEKWLALPSTLALTTCAYFCLFWVPYSNPHYGNAFRKATTMGVLQSDLHWAAQKSGSTEGLLIYNAPGKCTCSKIMFYSLPTNNFKLERLKPNGFLFVRFLISQTEMKTFGLTIRSLKASWLKICMVEVEGIICVCVHITMLFCLSKHSKT